MKPFFNRCLAALLALMLAISNASGLSLHASAADTAAAASGGSLLEIVADNYFANDGKGSGILTSGALTVDQTVSIAYPSAGDGLVTLTDDILTAAEFASGYENLQWVPYTYTVVDGTTETVYHFNGTYQQDLSQYYYDRVEVVYRLTLSNLSDSEVLALVNLPSVLSGEADCQLSALGKLSADSVYGSLGKLNNSTLSILSGMMSSWTGYSTDTNKNAQFQAHFSGVMTKIQSDCVDKNNSDESLRKYLTLYNLLTEYKSAGSGMAWYYQNSEKFIREFNLFSGYLDEMLADNEKITALATLKNHNLFTIPAFALYAAYIDKLVDLKTMMAEVREDLLPPNDAIDITSDKLETLTDALELDGTPASWSTLSGGITLESEPIELAAEKNFNVTVSLVINGKTTTITRTYLKKEAITQAQVDELTAAIDAVLQDAALDIAFYDSTYDVSELTALVGTTQRKDLSYSYTWTPKVFTVKIDGETDRTVTVENRKITLPFAPAANCRYDYTIGDKTVPQGSYTFTKDELTNLFVNGNYTISRVLINLAEEELDQFVADLNEQSDGSGQFELNEDRTELTANLNGTAGLTNTLMVLMNSQYSPIEIGGYPVIYTNEAGETEVSLQALINAFIDSGMTSEEILAGNGDLNIKTTMKLRQGTTEIDLILYLNMTGGMESVVETLTKGQDVLSFRCGEGTIWFEVDLPESIYEIYLAALLLNGNVDVRDVNRVNAAVAREFLNDYFHVLLGGDVTTTTYANTLDKLGRDTNLDGFDAVLEQLKGLTINEDGYSLALVITRDQLQAQLLKAVSEQELELASQFIKELKDPNGQVIINADIAIADLKDSDGDGYADKNNEYQAVIVNLGTVTGQSRRVYLLTANLSETLSTLNFSAAVVLQQDITADLVFDRDVLLDLNGHTITGSVTANGSLVIFDSTMVTANCGGVTGTITGSNVTILAGRYGTNVSAHLGEGCVQKNGMVSHSLYSITADASGKLTIHLNSSCLGDPAALSAAVQNLSAQLFGDLLLGYYTKSGLSFGSGMNIYQTSFQNGVTVEAMAINGFDCSGVSAFLNSLIGELTDYASLAEKILAGKPVASYVMTTRGWDVTVSHDTAEDCFDMDVTPSGTTSGSVAVDIVIDGDAKTMAALATKLKDLVSAELALKLEKLSFAEGDVKAQGSGNAAVSIDLSANPDHAALLALALVAANGKNSAMITALNGYFAGGSTAAMQAEFEKYTVAQVLAAVKKLDSVSGASALVSAAGVTASAARISALESIFPAFRAAAKWMTAYLSGVNGSTGMAALLSKNELESGTYLFHASGKTYQSETTVRCHGSSGAVTADVDLTVKLFSGKPLIGVPTLSDSASLYAASVSQDGFLLYLDTVTGGITVSEFKALVSAKVYNDVDGAVVVTVNGAVKRGDQELIPTGATVTLTATNNGGVTTSVTYTILVLGDTNCNGRIESNDNVLIARHFVGKQTLGSIALKAADVNRNGRLDSNDAVRNSIKFVRSGDYVSKLG